MDTTYQDLKKYVGFSSEDAARISSVKALVEPSFPDLVDAFYERVRSDPTAAAAFREPAQMERQRRALLGWLDRFFSDSRDREYMTRAARVGEVHVRVGLPQRYILAGMHVLREGFARVLRAAGRGDDAALFDSLHRGIDLELAVMMDAYFVAELSRAQEAERREATRRSERLASVGILAAGLAHEIRNPLNGAQLHLTLLRRQLAERGELDAELTEAIVVVSAEIKRLSSLVTEFLEFARPPPLDVRAIDLRDVCAHAVSAVAGDSAALGVDLKVELPDSSLNVEADKQRMTQALVNILRNAIEAASDVTPGSTSMVVMRGREGHELEVEDTGHGIPRPDTPIFDPFFTTKARGTGLGLSVAHRIVTDHDGTLSFSSSPGRTVFTIKLPASNRKASRESP